MLNKKWQLTRKNAVSKLTGAKRRAIIAQVTQDYFDGSARKAETQLGWSRQAIRLTARSANATGLKELETGITCVDNYQGRGRKKTAEILPNLSEDIQSLLDTYSQADPKFQSTACLCQNKRESRHRGFN